MIDVQLENYPQLRKPTPNFKFNVKNKKKTYHENYVEKKVSFIEEVIDLSNYRRTCDHGCCMLITNWITKAIRGKTVYESSENISRI